MTVILCAALLACFAIACLPWSSIAAKGVLVAAICHVSGGARLGGSGMGVSLCARGVRMLPGGRVVPLLSHRALGPSVRDLYGYGATFAVMGAASLRGWAIFALAGIWVLGTAAIFAAKSLTVRWAVKHIAGYRA